MARCALRRDRVAGGRGREPALRAHREPLGAGPAGRVGQPGRQLGFRLDPRRLGRDQAEHDDLVVRHQAERVEAARPLVVVLEQQPVGVNPAEHRPGDRLVAARDQPPAELIAAAQVEAERGRPPGLDHRVVELDRAGQPPLGRPAARLVERPPGRVDQQRIVRRVELDVRAAQPHQLGGLVAQDGGHVGHEVVERRVRARRPLRRPEVGEQRRARQRDLDLPVGAGAQVGELLGGQVAPLTQPRGHGEVAGAGNTVIPDVAGMPVAPEPGIHAHAGDAFARGGELGLERVAPHLAVVHDRQADVLLQRDDLADGPVLGRLESRLGQPRRGPGRPAPASGNRGGAGFRRVPRER